MFKFLKDKLKSVVSSFTKKVDEEAKEVPDEPKVPDKKPVVSDKPEKQPDKAPEPKIEEKKIPLAVEKPEQKFEKVSVPKEIVQPEVKVDHKKPEHKHEVKQTPHLKSHKKDLPPKIESTLPHKKKIEPVLPKADDKKAAVQAEVKPEPVKEEQKVKPVQEKPEVKPEKKEGFFQKIFGKKEQPELKVEPVLKVEQKIQLEVKPEPEKRKGFIEAIAEKITHKELSDSKFEELFWDLEVTLLENNVAVEVIDKIKTDLKKELVGVPLKRNEIDEVVVKTLKKSINELFDVPSVDIIEKISQKKPYIIMFLGINGAGKTTTIAKFAYMLKSLGLKVVIAAADTFRAAAIDQIETHANNIGVKLIKQEYGSDAAAVAFDAIEFAKAKEFDVVLIDTAGRLHSNTNLMDELKKIVRVSKADMKVFIGESITGNDCIEQAKQFNEAVGIDGIILSKADVDEKGGAAISVSFVTGKPILYLGIGQEYKDLQEFKPGVIVESLGLA